MKIYRTILLIIIACLMPLVSHAERNTDEGMFNHLSLGGTLGTTGYGIDVAMPCTKLVSLRAGVSILRIGEINFNAPTTLANVLTDMKIIDKNMEESLRNTDAAVLINPRLVNAHIIADIYPFKHSTFHFSAGVFVGNNTMLGVYNKTPGSFKFLNRANEYVEDYNRLFGTKYSPVGIQFGDYLLTADKNGNVDAEMRINPVRPYVGIGMGRCLGRTNRCSVMMDAGFMFWGTPKFRLNHEKTISSGDSQSSFLGTFSSLKAFPVIQLRIAGDIF